MCPAPTESIDIEDGMTHETASNTYNTALKLAEAHGGDEIDPAAEKKLIKKIDWLLMPLVSNLLP